MKCVYSLICGGDDAYAIMTAISAVSVKLSNPKSPVVLVTDQATANELKVKRHVLLNIVDELLVVHVPDGDRSWRSRFLKTSLGFNIEGPFLFIDADTLVRSNVAEICAPSHDMAAAKNHSSKDRHSQIWSGHREILARMGWEQGDRDYLNSGIIYYSGSAASRAFAEAWHASWLQSAAHTGTHVDQLAFNHVIGLELCRCGVLPDSCNAQVLAAPEVAFDAAVWHFFSSIEDTSRTVFTDLVQSARTLSAKRLECAVARAVKRRIPWTLETAPYLLETSLLEAYRSGQKLRWSELTLLLRLCGTRKNYLLAACAGVGLSDQRFVELLRKAVALKATLTNRRSPETMNKQT